jgi:hypothetical protein
MRNFSSAVRFSYKRLLEGFTPSQAYTITRQKFPELNSHYVSCAVEIIVIIDFGLKQNFAKFLNLWEKL